MTLDFGTLTRFLADHFQVTAYHQSRIYCQFRQYLINTLPAVATLFIVLATMDRYVSTSSKIDLSFMGNNALRQTNCHDFFPHLYGVLYTLPDQL